MHLTHGPLSPFSLPRPPPDTVTSFLSYFKRLQVGSPALGQALSSSLRNRSDQDTPLLSKNLPVHGVGIARRVGKGNEGGGGGEGFRKLHLGWRFVTSGLGRQGIGLSGPPSLSAPGLTSAGTLASVRVSHLLSAEHSAETQSYLLLCSLFTRTWGELSSSTVPQASVRRNPAGTRGRCEGTKVRMPPPRRSKNRAALEAKASFTQSLAGTPEWLLGEFLFFFF